MPPYASFDLIPLLLSSSSSYAVVDKVINDANSTVEFANEYIDAAFLNIKQEISSGQQLDNVIRLDYTALDANGNLDPNNVNYNNPIKFVTAGSPPKNLSCNDSSQPQNASESTNYFYPCLIRPTKVFSGPEDTGTSIDCNNIIEPDPEANPKENGNANYYYCKNQQNILIQIEFKDRTEYQGMPTILAGKKLLFIGLAAFNPVIDFTKNANDKLKTYMNNIQIYRCFNPQGVNGDGLNGGIPAGFITSNNTYVPVISPTQNASDVSLSLCFRPIPS